MNSGYDPYRTDEGALPLHNLLRYHQRKYEFVNKPLFQSPLVEHIVVLAIFV